MNEQKPFTYRELFEQHIGGKVAILCARYNYRGTVSQVGDQFVVLANSTCVEQSGPASGQTPTQEDPIPSSIVIAFQAIELVYWPNWLEAPVAGSNR